MESWHLVSDFGGKCNNRGGSVGRVCDFWSVGSRFESHTRKLIRYHVTSFENSSDHWQRLLPTHHGTSVVFLLGNSHSYLTGKANEYQWGSVAELTQRSRKSIVYTGISFQIRYINFKFNTQSTSVVDRWKDRRARSEHLAIKALHFIRR